MSDNVVISAPMSYLGSARRLWKLTRLGAPWFWVLTIPMALSLVTMAWLVVTVWYAVFGILLVPYRLIRRGHRRDKQAALRHRELLDASRKAA